MTAASASSTTISAARWSARPTSRPTTPTTCAATTPRSTTSSPACARCCPASPSTASQIVYAYSGIRPLPASDATAPGLVSRDHSAPVAEPEGDRPFPIVSLVGGKWTTFRGFAEEVADTLLARLGRARRVSTRDLPIGGGRDFPADRASWLRRGRARDRPAGGPARHAARPLRNHGARVRPRRGRRRRRCACPTRADYSCAEIDWIARTERVAHLADIVLRRTTLAITGDADPRATSTRSPPWPAPRSAGTTRASRARRPRPSCAS